MGLKWRWRIVVAPVKNFTWTEMRAKDGEEYIDWNNGEWVTLEGHGEYRYPDLQYSWSLPHPGNLIYVPYVGNFPVWRVGSLPHWVNKRMTVPVFINFDELVKAYEKSEVINLLSEHYELQQLDSYAFPDLDISKPRVIRKRPMN